MDVIIEIFVFILGMLIGSFLNVAALRYNTGKTLGGRSGCFSCGKQLHWYELLPVASFAMQKGRCKGCKASISWQYPLVELLTGVIFLAVFLREMNLVTIAFYWIVFSLLIVILVYDFRHKIIPDGLVYTFITLSFLDIFGRLGLFGLLNLASAIAHGHWIAVWSVLWLPLVSGPILFAPFFLLWWVSKGRWIGLGDGKLALGIGWLFGLTLGVSAIIYAFWIGALVSIILLAFRSKRYSMRSEIPFAPFIILAVFLTYYFRVDVVSLISGVPAYSYAPIIFPATSHVISF